jgi:hypothetical protein
MKVTPQLAPAAIFGLPGQQELLRFGDRGMSVGQVRKLQSEQGNARDQHVARAVFLDSPAAVVALAAQHFVQHRCRAAGPGPVLVDDPPGQ